MINTQDLESFLQYTDDGNQPCTIVTIPSETDQTTIYVYNELTGDLLDQATTLDLNDVSTIQIVADPSSQILGSGDGLQTIEVDQDLVLTEDVESAQASTHLAQTLVGMGGDPLTLEQVVVQEGQIITGLLPTDNSQLVEQVHTIHGDIDGTVDY